MQTTSANFTSEEKDVVRSVTASALVSWKKARSATATIFTVGTSTIGGADTIASYGYIVSDWNKYLYSDESANLIGMAYERALKMPTGGLSMAQYEVDFENTDGRFTPRHMGGSSELFTASYKVARPTIISAGFKVDGIDTNVPQMVGINNRPMSIDMRTRQTRMTGTDFIGFLRSSYLDNQIMFTAQRTDQVLTTLMSSMGYSSSQYSFDTGINTIPFGLFDTGTRFSDVVDQLVEAENGHFYQDEVGRLRFENRQHWDHAPYNQVQKILATAHVIDAESPSDDHIINVVEVVSKLKAKQPLQVIANFTTATIIAGSSSVELFFNYSDPILAVTTPTNGGANSYYLANDNSDGSGVDRTSSVTVTSIDNFARASRITFRNSSTLPVYLTTVVISGRPVKDVADIYVRAQDDSSVTAYQERPFRLQNDYIQNQDWAASYAQMILNDYAEAENLQRIKIRARPDLQLGDLISWQGRYWRIFDIKTVLNPANGFTQELTLLQRTITSYFRIGISTIGSGDKIAP